MSDLGQRARAKAAESSKPRRAVARRATFAGYEPMPSLQSLGTLHAWAGNGAVSSLLGSGMPLPETTRREFEHRFGTNFADIRIHDDSLANASADGLVANAYTVGSHIVFSRNRYAPHAFGGKRLLAHELAHVIQQRRGGAAPALDANAPHEQGADAAASAFAAGAPAIAVQGATAVGVARDAKEDYHDFYWTAFFANRAFQRKFKDWPVDPDLVKLWAKVPTTDEQHGGSSPEHKEFADTVKAYQRDRMPKGTKVNGAVDPPTAEALRKEPITRIGTTTVTTPAPKRVHETHTINRVEYSEADDSLGEFGDTAIDIFATALAGGPGLQQRMIAAAMKGAIAETRRELVDEGKKERLKARLSELENPLKALSVVGSYVGGLIAGAVSPVTDLFGLAAVVDKIPHLGEALVEGAIEHAPELAEQGYEIAKKLDGLINEMASALSDFMREAIKDPSTVLEMIEKQEQKAVTWARQRGHGVAAEVIKMIESPWEEAEKKPDPGWASVLPSASDVLLNTPGAAFGTAGRFFEYGTEKAKEKILTTPWSRVAFAVGHAIGAVIVQVLLFVFSEGIGTAISKISSTLGELAPFLKTIATAVEKLGEAITVVEEAIAAVAKLALKPLERFTKPLGELLESLAEWLRTLLGIAKKEATPAVTTATAKTVDALAEDTGKLAPKPHAPPKVEPHPSGGTSAADDTAAKAVPKTPSPTEGKPNVPPKVTSKIDPEPKLKVEPKPKIEPEPKAKVEPKPKAKVEPKPKAKVEPKPKAKVEPKPKAKVEPKPKAKVEPKPKAKAEPKPKAKAKPKPKPKPKAKPAAKAAPAGKATDISAFEKRLKALDVPADKRKAFEKAAEHARNLAQKDPEAAERMLEGLEERFGPKAPKSGVQDAFDEAQGKVGPDKGPSGKHTQSTAAEDRARQEQSRPSRKQVKKARVRESEKLGDTGGRAKAEADGIEITDWDTPQQHKGDYGRGIDRIGKRGNKTVVLEWKYGGSTLSKSKNGVVQMSDEWLGRKIAELEKVGDKATADALLKALDEGNLEGAVYWTRQLKGGEKTTLLQSYQLRDKLGGEIVGDDGVIRYSKERVRAAYDEWLKDLDEGIAKRDMKRLGNL